MTRSRPVGRPRKLNRLNRLGCEFRALYLDPLLHAQDICRQLGISLRTYYRYEKELDLPTLRVAIGNWSGLPAKKAFSKFLSPMDRYEFGVIRSVAMKMPARLRFIPVDSDRNGPEKEVLKKTVDMGISSISWTRARSRHLYFSESYLFDSDPQGALFFLKGHELPSVGRPLLGVAANTIHEEYALANLRDQFEVVSVVGFRAVIQALKKGEVHAVLQHPAMLVSMREDPSIFEVRSKPYLYKSFTGIVFHNDSEIWRPAVNKALEIMHEENEFEKIKIFTGRP